MIIFNSSEKQAIYHIVMLLMMVDGHLSAAEGDYWRKVAKLMQMSEQEQKSSVGMSKVQAISIVRNMTAQKRMVALKMFTEMVVADGHVHPKEDALIKSIMDEIDIESAAQSIGDLSRIKPLLDEYAR